MGLGSVGGQITESLAKTGISNILLVDFDTIEEKNLDRMPGASYADIGKKKVSFYKELIEKVAPSPDIIVDAVADNIAHENAFRKSS